MYVITLTAGLLAAWQTSWEERRFFTETSMRGEAMLETISETELSSIESLSGHLRSREKIEGLALCQNSQPVAPADTMGSSPTSLSWGNLCAASAREPTTRAGWLRVGGRRYIWNRRPLDTATRPGVELLLVQDASDSATRGRETFLRTLLSVWITGVLILFFITQQARRWLRVYLKALQSQLRALVAGRQPSRVGSLPHQGEVVPVSRDLEHLAKKILELPPQITTAENPDKPSGASPSSVAHLRETIGNHQVAVYANREPYIHQKKDDRIEVIRPASGLVTALEPILRYCGGLWIGHGSGNADRETADSHGEIAVPPGQPSYKLKRVWLTPEEEMGYYYGFSNEGLWPLCHLAHNRPTFRLADWEYYTKVNQRFCDETPERALETGSLLLVQDYHFALLPRMLRTRAQGRARIGLFWHIPWPNPEAFGICPWGKELLHGMLGAHVVGFHTQYHCNNFLETCDRYLEARVDWENFSVTMENHETLVRAFPIGIDTAPVRTLSEPERVELKKKYGLNAELIAVGVDRLDYTKGLVERVESVERFLEKYPSYVGRFTLAQVGSPSRTHIPAYRLLAQQLEDAVKRVNDRFGKDDYKPVVLLASHHEWKELQYFYQIGDTCLVTSLHDGMNLVAKEYVWCQDPTRGSLILSKFAGASRELTEALIVNPYSIEEMADALATAFSFSEEERSRRMRAMREKIEGHNAFHWASDLVRALVSEVREESPAPIQEAV